MRFIETVAQAIGHPRPAASVRVPRRLRPRTARSTFLPMVDHELIRGMARVS
jgi:hypothetical protein